MIDGQGQNLAASPARPIDDEMQQGKGIPAARKRQRHGRGVMGNQPVVEPAVDGVDPAGRQPHSAWASIWPARVRTAGAALAA